MKVFKSKPKNFSYLLYRLIGPVFDPVKFIQGLYGYIWYIRDLIRYQIKDPKAKLIGSNLYPVLFDKTNFTSFDVHYFYLQLWAFEHILKNKPEQHVDVASSYQLISLLSIISKVTFIDIRPMEISLKNLQSKKGSILNLPYKNNSIKSLSCLHVAEHIGLGRYGDPIDPSGTKKACRELNRVLAKNGLLYFCLPIGKNRICFNAHRVHTPQTIIEYFKDLELLEFSVVDDNGIYRVCADPKKYENIDYGCGMFLFKK